MAGSIKKKAPSRKTPREPDPLSARMAEMAREERERRGWTEEELAERTGLSRSSVHNYLNLGKRGYTKWTRNIAETFAAAFEWSPAKLLGALEPQQKLWNPAHPAAMNGEEYCARCNEHLIPGAPVISFHNFLPPPLMTASVQRYVCLSQFAPIVAINERVGNRLYRAYNDFLDMRRQGFKRNGSRTLTIGIMLRSAFQRLVNRQPPYDRCSYPEVYRCLNYVIECIDERDYNLILIDDTVIEPSLSAYVDAYASLFTIGRSLAVRRSPDLSAVLSTDSHDIGFMSGVLHQFLTIADYKPEKYNRKAAIAEVRSFQQQIDNFRHA